MNGCRVPATVTSLTSASDWGLSARPSSTNRLMALREVTNGVKLKTARLWPGRRRKSSLALPSTHPDAGYQSSVTAIVSMSIRNVPSRSVSTAAPAAWLSGTQAAGGCADAGRAASARMANTDAACFMIAPEPGPAAAGPGPMIL